MWSFTVEVQGEPAVPGRHRQHSLHVCQKISHWPPNRTHNLFSTYSLSWKELCNVLVFIYHLIKDCWIQRYLLITWLLRLSGIVCYQWLRTHINMSWHPRYKSPERGRKYRRCTTTQGGSSRAAGTADTDAAARGKQSFVFCMAASSPPFNCAKIAESIARWPHGDCLVVFSNSLSPLPTEQILQEKKKASVKSPLEASESCGLKPLLEQCL